MGYKTERRRRVLFRMNNQGTKLAIVKLSLMVPVIPVFSVLSSCPFVYEGAARNNLSL